MLKLDGRPVLPAGNQHPLFHTNFAGFAPQPFCLNAPIAMSVEQLFHK